jgi:hypothetical protein
MRNISDIIYSVPGKYSEGRLLSMFTTLHLFDYQYLTSFCFTVGTVVSEDAGYSPRGAGYSPRSAGYSPKGAGYSPKIVDFNRNITLKYLKLNNYINLNLKEKKYEF